MNHPCSNTIFLIRVVVSIVVILAGVNAHGQLVISHPIDILTGLSDGRISSDIVPAFTTNSIEKVFDGNPFTEAGITTGNTTKLILYFNEPVQIGKNKVFLWHTGHWSLEIADSPDELVSQSGSYHLVVARRPHTAFAWDSTSFTPVVAKIIRLTAENTQGDGIHLGEWQIFSSITMTSLVIVPKPLKLVPGTFFQLNVEFVDTNGKTYPYNLNRPVAWAYSNPEVATVGEMGDIHAHATGKCLITATIGTLFDTTTVFVVPDFASPNAEPMTIKVALVLQDPVIDFTNMRRIHQVRGWTDPLKLVSQIIEEFNRASDGVVQFQVVETHDDEGIFSRLDGELMTIDTLAYYYSSVSRVYGRNVEGTLQNLAEIQGRIRFDYNAMIDYYDLANKRNNGAIHEVWVYAHPFASMYESQLVGPDAFWYNSPPLEHPGLEKLLSIMGWNYERGVAEAMESAGHRSESALVHAFGDRWDVFNENPTAWEIFTRIEKDWPGGAHVGNIHFPPNGRSDYDFSNRTKVVTYADNWKRYPILLNQTRVLNCEEWGCSHLGYMRWWFNHLPRYQGVTDGVLNNWWYYIVDYEGAVGLAAQLTAGEKKTEIDHSIPGHFNLVQNYPNPFNHSTQIAFTLPAAQHVTLKVFDILGRELVTLVDENKPAGQHRVKFSGKNLASGLYFYQISAGSFNQTKKLIVIK